MHVVAATLSGHQAKILLDVQRCYLSTSSRILFYHEPFVIYIEREGRLWSPLDCPFDKPLDTMERVLQQRKTLVIYESRFYGFMSIGKTSLTVDRIQKDEKYCDRAENVKGPLGLNLLYTVDEPLIDFIFVHGLGGGSRKSWSKSPNPFHYWPKHWLSQDAEFNRVRVHSFGYKADWNIKGAGVVNIDDFALALLLEIQSPEIRRANTKIVLIGHSMGGIVIKKAYIHARHNPALHSFASRIHTLYFLATPHRGSEFAKVLSNVLKISYGSKSFVKDLAINSTAVQEINDQFREFAEDIRLLSFYETLPCNLIFTNALIVDKTSATLGFPGEQRSPLDADHRGVCKFDLPSDPNYRLLRNSFLSTLDSIFSKRSATAIEGSYDPKPIENNDELDEGPEDIELRRARLVELTGVSEPPVDELSELKEIRVSGSCEWLTMNSLFNTWKIGSDSPPVFCLTGNAGAGKSVLSGYVIEQLEDHDLKHGYFFFKHGDIARSSVAQCLLSLAYQMSTSNPAILKGLTDLQQYPKSWDDRSIWRKLYIGIIFKAPTLSLNTWIIDAIDECQKPLAFLNLLSKIPSNIKVLITGRYTPEVAKGITILGSLSEHYQIQPEDTITDLNLFADSKISFLTGIDKHSQTKLKEKILRKSSGSFLWVSLIFQELEYVYSEEAAEEVLEETPADMDRLYTRMLGYVPKHSRATNLARSIFTWVILSMRPLSIDELQYVLKLDINESVFQGLAGSISGICGQLVCVGANNSVQCIHQTAEAFLTQQTEYPSLAIDKQQGHTRIAEVCLKFLTSSFAKSPRPENMTEFADYASIFFSDHVDKCFSEDLKIWGMLSQFLEKNVLHWIEYLASTGRLHQITRTAKNLKAHVMQSTTLWPEKANIESWISDLIRLCAKFRANLELSPSSIHNLVPALCPSDSIVFKTYSSQDWRLNVQGYTDKTWNECLARIDYPDHWTTAVVYGARHLAVGAFDGTVFVYYGESIQRKYTLDLGECVKILAFGCGDQYLASSGRRNIVIWDLETSNRLWTFNTEHRTLDLLFLNNNVALSAATRGNFTIVWNLKGETKEERWQWTDCLSGTIDVDGQPPRDAWFSDDHAILAVSYRGLPLYLFDIASERFIGYCRREQSEFSGGVGNHYYIDTMAFNPGQDPNVVIVSYGDGELKVYSLRSTEPLCRIGKAFAHNMTCSPNGRMLLTGTAMGMIQLFEFGGTEGGNLKLVYRIAYENGIHGVAFSNDSARFSDIRGSQCRVWEPTVLFFNGLDGGHQSELIQSVTLPSPRGMFEIPPEPEITAMCCDSSGKLMFCGKQDGSVVCIYTHDATRQLDLCQHPSNAPITCITYSEKHSLLVTADDFRLIWVHKVVASDVGADCKIVGRLASIRSIETPSVVILDISGTWMVVHGWTSVHMWTTSGENVEFSITLKHVRDGSTIMNHPLDTDYFLVIERDQVQTLPWDPPDNFLVPTFSVTPFSTEDQIIMQQAQNPFYPGLRQPPSNLIVFFNKETSMTTSPSSSGNTLRVWRVSTTSFSTRFSPLSLHSFDKLVHKIRQIIAVSGNLIIFLDTDFWVCSLDVTKCAPCIHYAQRHFFLLSEWQNNHEVLIVNYVPSVSGFVVVRKHGILLIKRGLEFEEPWFA